MDRLGKLRRLNAVRRSIPHISASALSALLSEIEAHGIPELHNRKQIKEATSAIVKQDTPYGQILLPADVITKTGTTSSVLLANPLALLCVAVEQGGGFSNLMEKRLQESPCNIDHPWKLVLYCDEVVPGDAMIASNVRKVWVIYFSFLELGLITLSNENSWFCVAAQRTEDVNRLSAGISQVMGIVIKRFFGSVMGCNAESGGVFLRFKSGNRLRFFCRLSMFVQDGAAHKYIWHCKGDGGMRCCMGCRNMFTQKSEVVDESGDNLLTCNQFTESELDFALDSDVRDTIRRLRAHKLTDPPAEFELREIAYGFNWEPHGLLFDDALADIMQPVSQYHHDWMHGMLVNGVFNTIVFLLLGSIHSAGMADIWSKLSNYLALWTWPVRAGNGADHYSAIFDKKRATSSRKAKHLKCSASDCLSIYPVLAFYIEMIVKAAGVCVTECLAFLACADLLDMLQAINLGVVTVDALRGAVHTLLDLCVRAGWANYMATKFHWLLHFAREFERFGCMVSCFVHERRHKVVKRYASQILNTTVYEESVLSEMVCHHLADLGRDDCFIDTVCLDNAHAASERMITFLSDHIGIRLSAEDIKTSYRARMAPAGMCSKGDICIVQNQLGGTSICGAEIWFHAELTGECWSLVSIWYAQDGDQPYGLVNWKKVMNPMLIPTDNIFAVCISKQSGDSVQTLIPYQFRNRAVCRS